MTKSTFRTGLATGLGIAAVILLGTSSFGAPGNSPRRQPNFVFILGEGHGWSSLSVQMDDAVPESKSDVVRTPNFEKLAQAGMRFADFYAPSPRCTPSRAALFTGKSPAQLQMTFIPEGKTDAGASSGGKVIPPRCNTELPRSEMTIGGILKTAGYATAHFGKWHVGHVSPQAHGFDETDGANSNRGPENVERPHPKQLFSMTERSLDFMTRQVQAGKPFYLQMSHYASRQIEDCLPQTVAVVRSWAGEDDERRIGEAASALEMDITLGMILQELDQLGIADNTYVIYTTDHGTPGRNPPLSGGKGTVSEGGLRVPLLIRGPGIKPGSCCHVRAVGVDLFPTIAQLARVTASLPDGLEGGSLVPLLINAGAGTVQRPREEYVVHFPHYDKDPLGPASTILLGEFKLIRWYETGTLQLFNITQDPGERRDLARDVPEKVRELDARLSQYLQAANAQMPTLNRDFDPTATPQPKARNKEKKSGRGKKGREP